jgi:hypothetical protein
MAREARDRFATCAELAQALGRWLDAAQERPLHRPRIGILAAATAVALTVVGVLSWMQHRSLQRAAEREDEIRAQLRATMLKIEEMSAKPPPPLIHLRLAEFKQIGDASVNEATSARISFKTNARFETILQIQETGVYEFTITASCDAARGEFAKFNLAVDGAVAGVLQMTAETPHDFGLSTRLAAGEHRLGIEFLNDFYNEATREDRNLYVHNVAYRKAK